MAKPPKPSPKAEAPEGPSVELTHFVLVRMPLEQGKPADRYAVVKVRALAVVADGLVIEDGLQLVYARKRVSLEVSRETDERKRNIQVLG